MRSSHSLAQSSKACGEGLRLASLLLAAAIARDADAIASLCVNTRDVSVERALLTVVLQSRAEFEGLRRGLAARLAASAALLAAQ